MEGRGTLSDGVAGMGQPGDRERRRKPLLRRRSLLIGITAAAVLVTWCARWYLHFTPYSGLVVYRDLEVVRVLSDGPGAKAGVRVGDRLLAIDGRAVANLTDYFSVMKDPALKGREVALSVRRGGERLALMLAVASYPILDASDLGPISGLVILAFGLFVHLRKPCDPASGLYLLLSVCLFVLLAISNHLLKHNAAPLLFLLWGTALVAVVPLNLHFYLVFPEPKPLVRSRPAILTALYAVPALFFVLLVSIVLGLERSPRVASGRISTIG